MPRLLVLVLAVVGVAACDAPTGPLPPCHRQRVPFVTATGDTVAVAVVVTCPDLAAGPRDTVDVPRR